MSEMRDSVDKKIDSHFEFVQLISEYWRQHGWLDIYGKEYLGWLLDFFIPLIRSKETNRKTEHILRLNAFISEFGLGKHLKSANISYRLLLNKTSK